VTLQVINRGARVGDTAAESVYDAFGKAIANFGELYGLYGSDVEAFTFTTKQNDLAIAAYTRIARWNGAGTTGITGIAAPSVARVVTIINASTDYLLWLENENTASAAANRLMLPDSFPAFLMPGDTITLFYDLTTARWRVLSWPTCGTGMGLTVLDDFDASISGPYSSRNGGTGSNGSNGSSSGVDASVRMMGARSIQCGTTSTGYAFIARGSAAAVQAPTLGATLIVSRGRVTTASSAAETFSALYGTHDTPLAGTFANGVCWEHRWNGSAAEMSRTVASGGAITRAASSGPPATSANLWLVVYVNPAWTRADFLYSTDGVSFLLDGSVSSGLPTVAQLTVPAWGLVKSNGVTDRTMVFDLVGHRTQQVRA